MKRRAAPTIHRRAAGLIGAGAVFVGQMFGLAFGVFGIWAMVEVLGMVTP